MNRAGFSTSFTPLTFDFLWEAAGIGELPYPLQVRSHGATMDERARLRRQALDELKVRGLCDHHGRLDPRGADWFRVLSQATISIDAVHIPDFQAPPVSILAATDGVLGVVAIQDASGIRVRPAFPEGLASTVVDLLPPGTRGTEASITLPVDEALRIPPSRPAVPVGGDPKPRRRSLSERPADPREAYARLAGQPRLRGGQLAANSRSGVHGRRRSPVLGWFDTATGRYLSLSRPGADGREWVTVSAADAKTLRTRLSEMVAAVTGEPGH
ncbi:ESX secretion-associated protein EspG [Amycolatopsis viridis]|uniref:ESX secretion-associated protein EspG n=1 Tax=Amycolatopsis viridis TaxID=185678 RepID=A0ABX0SMJ5_9PSEU|nr:ESX secretion-associated protein EspG [Amycolatopsis viridis]NIH78143.1 hypothetical protein [Amycolatopsis viridis]